MSGEAEERCAEPHSGDKWPTKKTDFIRCLESNREEARKREGVQEREIRRLASASDNETRWKCADFPIIGEQVFAWVRVTAVAWHPSVCLFASFAFVGVCNQ